jgi:hypothetical protein
MSSSSKDLVSDDGLSRASESMIGEHWCFWDVLKSCLNAISCFKIAV